MPHLAAGTVSSWRRWTGLAPALQAGATATPAARSPERAEARSCFPGTAATATSAWRSLPRQALEDVTHSQAKARPPSPTALGTPDARRVSYSAPAVSQGLRLAAFGTLRERHRVKRKSAAWSPLLVNRRSSRRQLPANEDGVFHTYV